MKDVPDVDATKNGSGSKLVWQVLAGVTTAITAATLFGTLSYIATISTKQEVLKTQLEHIVEKTKQLAENSAEQTKAMNNLSIKVVELNSNVAVLKDSFTRFELGKTQGNKQ